MMMGIPVDGPANMFCDNESVVKSTSTPESTLKKKHISKLLGWYASRGKEE
jgi:hypothetical protein